MNKYNIIIKNSNIQSIFPTCPYYPYTAPIKFSPTQSPKNNCSSLSQHDITTPDTTKESIQGDIVMSFFDVNWNNYTDQLASIAAPESWSNNSYPNNGILTNYIVNTYRKLQSERKIVFTSKYTIFNTGLFTKYCEPIYAYQSESNISFLTDYDLGNICVSERPERANYFANPDLLLFDWHYPINVQYKHILEDKENKERLPKFVQESDIAYCILEGVVNKTIRMVMANYKIAVPQYFNEKIQLLLPLYFTNTDKADLVLVLTKTNNYYQGHTCITTDMAYNNARLIAKPESNWLAK